MRLNIRSDLGLQLEITSGAQQTEKNRRLRKVAKTEKSMDTWYLFLVPSLLKFIQLCFAVSLIFLHCATVIQKALSIRKLPLQGTALNYSIKYFLHSIISVLFQIFNTLLPTQPKYRWSLLLHSKCSCGPSLGWRGFGDSQKQGKAQRPTYSTCFPIF